MDPQIYLDALEAEASETTTTDDYEYTNPFLAAGAQAMRQMGAMQREMHVQMQNQMKAHMEATAEMVKEHQRQQEAQSDQGLHSPGVNSTTPVNPFEMFSFPFGGGPRR